MMIFDTNLHKLTKTQKLKIIKRKRKKENESQIKRERDKTFLSNNFYVKTFNELRNFKFFDLKKLKYFHKINNISFF